MHKTTLLYVRYQMHVPFELNGILLAQSVQKFDPWFGYYIAR